MITGFENVCCARVRADEIERHCEEVLNAMTHTPMTAMEIATRGNIYSPHNPKPCYQRVAGVMGILQRLNLVKMITELVDHEIEIPEQTSQQMIVDKQVDNVILSYHYEVVTVPAHKDIVQKEVNKYCLV